MDVLILVVCLGVVTLGAEILVRSASIVALRAGVSALFVGLTIVGFGTSSPELAASISATLNGSSDIAIGNVVGSNIFNVAVILGLTAAIRPVRVALSAIRRDLAVAFCGSALLLVPLALDNVLPRWLGAVMFLGLVGYLTMAYRADRRAKPADQELCDHEVRSSLAIEDPPQPAKAWYDATWVHFVLIVVGLALLVFGADGFVTSAVAIAKSYGVSADVIGLTIVSAGTSLPELVTSIVAARRGNPDIAIGNVIGSNIFNALGIAGIAALVAPQVVSPAMIAVDVPVMLVSMLVLVPILGRKSYISRFEGGLLLAGYGVYLAYLLVARTG
jgi:cation:H+ antiporter